MVIVLKGTFIIHSSLKSSPTSVLTHSVDISSYATKYLVAQDFFWWHIPHHLSPALRETRWNICAHSQCNEFCIRWRNSHQTLKNRSDAKLQRKYRVCLIPPCTVSPESTKANRVQREGMRDWDSNRQWTHTHTHSGMFHNAKRRIVSPVFKWTGFEWRSMQAWAGASERRQRGGKFMGVTHSKPLSLFLVWTHKRTHRVLVVSFNFQVISLSVMQSCEMIPFNKKTRLDQCSRTLFFSSFPPH